MSLRQVVQHDENAKRVQEIRNSLGRLFREAFPDEKQRDAILASGDLPAFCQKCFERYPQWGEHCFKLAMQHFIDDETPMPR
jgi:hypothetical protein